MEELKPSDPHEVLRRVAMSRGKSFEDPGVVQNPEGIPDPDEVSASIGPPETRPTSPMVAAAQPAPQPEPDNPDTNQEWGQFKEQMLLQDEIRRTGLSVLGGNAFVDGMNTTIDEQAQKEIKISILQSNIRQSQEKLKAVSTEYVVRGPVAQDSTRAATATAPAPKKRRGRPPGSKNKKKGASG